MLEIVKKTSPAINRWLTSVEKDANVDAVLLQMLQGMEAKPDLMKLLVMAKDMVQAKEPRLVGLATLMIGGFDHPRAHSFLELLMSNSDPRLRLVSLEAAQLGGTLWGLRKCMNALADKEQAVRARAQELCAGWDPNQLRQMFEDLLSKGDTASLSDAAEGLSRIAEAPLMDLVEKTFDRVDLSLKRKLARGLVRIATPELIAWVEEWQKRLADQDGYKVLDMSLVEMRRGPAAAPGPTSATSMTNAPAAPAPSGSLPAAQAPAAHAPAPEPAAPSSRGGGFAKLTPEQQAAMYTNPAFGGGGVAVAPSAPAPAAAPAAAPSGRTTQRRMSALPMPEIPIVNPGSSIGDLVPTDLPDPEQLANPAARADATGPISRPVGRDSLLTSVSSTPADKERIHQLLKELVTYGGSDIHVTAGKSPAIRQEGDLVALDLPALSAAELTSSIAAVANPRQLERYLKDGDLDMSIGVPGAGRFRVNFLKTRGVPGMVARLIPNDVPSLTDLNLPPAVNTLVLEPKGLLLVTGPVGSGKATTLATLVDLINSSRRGHIVTLDDPLEFIHRDRQCTVTQREVGTDVRTFAEGIRFAQRMDADAILVGELSDPETIRAAFVAVGAGRLVLGSCLAGSAVKALDRVIQSFPGEQQAQARINLATHLLAVITQNLLHQQKGGRVPAHEVLIATGTIRKALRENQPQAIYAQIESGASHGMVTMEQSLARLLKGGVITREEAFSRASDPAVLSQQL